MGYRSIFYVITGLLFFSGVGRDDVPLKEYYRFAEDSVFRCIGEAYATKGNTFILSCVVIGDRYLLSAAHGYYVDSDSLVMDSVTVLGKKYPLKRPASSWLDEAGSFYFRIGGKKYYARKITVHPDFVSDFGSPQYNDIALIELTEPIGSFHAAVLYTGSSEGGSRGIACGYGAASKAQNNGIWPFARRKKMAGENHIDSLGGNRLGDQWGVLFADMDHPRTSVCNRMGSSTPLPLEWRSDQGDCGSGLFIQQDGQWRLAGISFGPSYFDDEKTYREKYGYYGFIDGWTRISPLVEWIEGSMGR